MDHFNRILKKYLKSLDEEKLSISADLKKLNKNVKSRKKGKQGR